MTPHPRVGNDPLEQTVVHALDHAGIQYVTDYEGLVPKHLDFHLSDFDVFIEVKGGHSDRISNQMKRAPNVIAVQGLAAVHWFAKMLQTSR